MQHFSAETSKSVPIQLLAKGFRTLGMESALIQSKVIEAVVVVGAPSETILV